MAFYIIIIKIDESIDKVVYAFCPNKQEMGKLEITKKNGTIEILKPLEIQNSQALFKRAAAKVYKHWKNNEFPPRTAWES
ncbi:MAG: hypothetical protein SWY16_18365 [Cyanobacteriota bacterium]|nr:hypothetical protein [Cyanobacteriota bacterium]